MLPGVLLACHILPVFTAIREIQLPEIIDALRSWSVKLLPDLPCDYSRETRVSRASRDSTAILSSTDGKGELWYVVEWPDEATMKAAWDDFRANPEWIATKKATEADGPLVASLQNMTLRRASYFKP